MAKYRIIYPRIWNDEKVRGLTVEAQRVLVHVLTHPGMTPIGCLRTDAAMLASQTAKLSNNPTSHFFEALTEGLPEGLREGLREGLPEANGKAYQKGVLELSQKGLIKLSETEQLLWVPNFLKYNKPANPNVLKSWNGCIDDLPECDLLREVIQSISNYLDNQSDAFRKAYRKALAQPSPKQEQEQEQEQEQDKNIISPSGDIVSETVSGSKTQATQDTTDEKQPTPKTPNCPHEKIRTLYNEILPELPPCKNLTDTRKKYLAARWRQKPSHQNLNYWHEYFNYIRNSKFLMGEKNDFQANFDWIIKPTNFQKIIEGTYHD